MGDAGFETRSKVSMGPRTMLGTDRESSASASVGSLPMYNPELTRWTHGPE